MIRRPPRSTRTDTLFPYTTLFRSTVWPSCGGNLSRSAAPVVCIVSGASVRLGPSLHWLVTPMRENPRFSTGRSEERRAGTECVGTFRSRWSPSHENKNTTNTHMDKVHEIRTETLKTLQQTEF